MKGNVGLRITFFSYASQCLHILEKPHTYLAYGQRQTSANSCRPTGFTGAFVTYPGQWLTSIELVLELADLVLESVNSNAEPMADPAKIGKWVWALVSNLQKPSISLCDITGSRSGLT